MRVLCCLLLVWSTLLSGCGKSKEEEKKDAVAAIKKLGGTFQIGVFHSSKGGHFDEPVVKVDLSGRPVTDAGLDHLKGLTSLETLSLLNTNVTDAGLVHLKRMTNLKTLNLSGTKVTDAGLVHLKGLMGLQTLSLDGTEVTDAGLEHFKELTKIKDNYTKVNAANLQTLSLGNTQVTDAGLVHLKGLTKLRSLYLQKTKVTDAGVKDLQSALPKCRINK